MLYFIGSWNGDITEKIKICFGDEGGKMLEGWIMLFLKVFQVLQVLFELVVEETLLEFLRVILSYVSLII